jgi:hypothetical protein
VNHLAAVEGLKTEAMDLLRTLAYSNPTTDVEVIQEFATLARARELSGQLGWAEPELAELYRFRAQDVRAIIDKEVGTK